MKKRKSLDKTRSLNSSSTIMRKLTSFVLAFLILFSPLAPVFAQEADSISSTPSADIGEISDPLPDITPTETKETLIDPDPIPPSIEESLSEEVLLSEEESSLEEKIIEEEPEMESMSIVGSPESLSRASESANNRISSKIDNLTGSLLYEYEIVVPPGRDKMTPDVVLTYNSANSKNDSVVGSGWDINTPSIERLNITGSNNLYTADNFVSSFDGELISLGSGNYAAKNEGGNFLKYSLSSNAWTVTDKEGTVYKFGDTAASRQDNSADTSKVFKWMLEEVRDTNDNYIKYEYYKDAGQIYPLKITYTGNGSTDGILEVNFDRSSRSGGPTLYDTGFSVKSNYRITEIRTEVDDVWARKYTLAYTTGDNGSGSLLNTITESGQDDSSTVTTLPAVDFDYKTTTANWSHNSSLTMPIPFLDGSEDTGVRMADINGDGLVDIVCRRESSSYCSSSRAYLNNGSGGWTDVSSTWVLPQYFLFSSGEDTGLRIVDLNGDGLSDLVRTTGNSSDPIYVYINNGSGWTHNSSLTMPLPFLDSGLDYGVRFADINGDGLVDILCHNDRTGSNDCPNNSPKIFLNDGAGGWTDVSSTWLFPFFPGQSTDREVFLNYSSYYSTYSDSGLRVVDLNGDGLADLVRTSGSYSFVYMNNGSGWTYESSLTVPIPFPDNSIDTGVRMADVNGDGLIDILCRRQSGSYCSSSKAHLNNGSGGWTDVSSTWVLPQYFLFSSGEDTGLRTVDLNGDGLPDLVRAYDDDSFIYINNGNSQPNILTKISYTQGGETTISYKPTTFFKDGSNNLLNPEMPLITDVVYQITNDDGLGGEEEYTYEYQGGDYYFNTSLDRKLAGFEKITVTDGEGNVKKTYYHQGNSTNTSLGEHDDHFSKIGKAYRLEEYDDSGNLYNLTIDKIDKYNIGTDHNFVKTIRRTVLNYDGDGDHADTASEYAYDDTYGNLTEKIDWGKVTASTDGSFTDTGSDKSTETIIYVANTTDHIVGLPYQDTVVDQSSAKVRESKIYYDTQSLGSVTDGNVTKVEDWVTSSTYINNQKTYDSYGLVSTSTDSRGKVTSYSYDSYNLYPEEITNPLSQVTEYVYDYSLGKPKEVTDQNGFVYETIYDGLDRVKEEKIPGFGSPFTPVTKTAYTYTDTSGVVKIQRTDHLDGSISKDTYQYFDGFGRLIQERKEAEIGFNVKDIKYNDVGLILKESLPYSDSGSSKTSATGTSALYTSYTYDPLQRPLAITNALGTTSYEYDDWKTTITDAESNVKHYYKDARGNLIQVDEVNGGSTYTTNYEYNLNNKLTKITDALSNLRNFTYDGLGRRLTAEDLHASGDGTFGSWTYGYDNAGNMTQFVNPRSQTVNYTYDDINRVSTEDYTGSGGTEISYSYDSCTNGVGKLCSVTMSSGANTAYTYNSLGGIASEAKTINSVAYTTSYTYDRQGNTLIITYPDSAEAKYTYNTAGLLETVETKESGGSYADVISDFDYSPMNQVTVQEYANGQTTTNVYDSAKMYRLTDKQTSNNEYVSSSNTNPIITLTGSSLVNLNVGDTWTEPGYSATDTEDGTITGSVSVTGSVNTSVAATYQLVYAVVDSEGASAARKIRTVVVTSPSMTVKALIIGGGGGGGKGTTRQGGGGGAGGYQQNDSVSITPQAYSIVVGAGGNGSTSNTSPNGTNGGNSSAFGLTSTGGGVGASGSGNNGSSGSSGGGGAPSNGSVSGGTGTGGQGNNGGTGFNSGTATFRSGGGGGGANTSGGNGSTGLGGNGGAGISSSISGSSVTRAGGGGGAGSNGSTGGAGGGGNGGGGGPNGQAGTANTGGGGGGGGLNEGGNGGAGGSGVVIIAYKTDGSDGVSNSSTGGTITTSGAYTIHTFNSSGTFTAVFYASSSNAPVITLAGSDLINLTMNDTWSEPGYSATDVEDGTLTSSVTTTGSVNTAIAGTYQLVYSVVDSSETPAARKIRTVVIHPPEYLQNISYTYDNVNNITQIVDASDTDTSKTVAYVYDDLNRMTSATATSVVGGQSTYTHTYVYDALGNITSGPIGSYTYAGTNYANPHAATSINGVTYSYDNSGNITGNGTLANTWNYKDQLTQAVLGGVTSTYTYDHMGERASLANGTMTTVYPNDYYNTDGTKQTKSIYAGDQLIATIETVSSVVTPYYIHVDHLGSTTATSDGSGALVETLDYFPYGNQRISSGTHTEQRQYLGQIYDADTDLNYLNARYYEGSIGRFISQDPIFLNPESEGKEIFTQFLSNPQTQNSYSYAINNPITLKDDTGKFTGLEMNPWTAALLVLFMPNETSYDPVYETEQYEAQNNPANQSMNMAITSTMPVGGKGNVAKGLSVGQDFGKMGKVVATTPGKLTSFTNIVTKDPYHGLNQAITRGISPKLIQDTVKNPLVKLQQGPNSVYLTKQGGVVLDKLGGLITTYSKSDFKPHVLKILKKIKR